MTADAWGPVDPAWCNTGDARRRPPRRCHATTDDPGWLRKAANIADASTRRRGSAKTSVQLDDLAALMAQLIKNGGASSLAPAAAAPTTAMTAPAMPATTATTTTTPTGPPRTDDRAVNTNLVMPEGAERSGNTIYAPSGGC